MKKQVKIAGIIIAALAIIGLIVWMSANKSMLNLPGEGESKRKPEGVPEEMLETQTPEAAEATQALINDVIGDGDQEIRETPGIGANEGEPVIGEDGEIIVTEVKPIKTVIVAPGTSGINVETGKVVNESGVALSNEAGAGSQAAPQSSFPIDSKDIPKSAIKLDVTSNSFSPAEFTVNRGQAVNFAVTNVNETTFSEVVRFDDPTLTAVVLGLAKGETRSITFNAPDKAGEYLFYSDMFNHREQGAEGKMIVK